MDAFEVGIRVLVLLGVVAQITQALRTARRQGYSPWRLVFSTVLFSVALIGWTLVLFASIILLDYRWWPVAGVALAAGGWLSIRLVGRVAGPPKRA